LWSLYRNIFDREHSQWQSLIAERITQWTIFFIFYINQSIQEEVDMKKINRLLSQIIFINFIIFPIFVNASVVTDEKTELNDDLYVEIKAQVNFVMSQAFKKYEGTEAVKKAAEAEEKIYKKFGVTREELDKYLTKISEQDVDRASKIIMKVARRTQELEAGQEAEAVPASTETEVKGFPGLPLYPGAESIAGSEMGDTEWALEMLKKEGYIWYEYGEKLCEEYNDDPKGVDNRIVDFYKEELAKKGWKYIGEGVRTHHWAKGDSAVGISFPADCSIEYIHMSVIEARGNCGKMEEDQFGEAFMKCANTAQEVCKEQGIQSMDDYLAKMGDEEALEKLNKKIEEGLNEALKPYGLTFKRFKEIKEGYNFDEIMERLYAEHEKEINTLQLGLMILSELME
jgi:hypothetical protein